MIKVQVRPNEPLETALRRFKRQCNYAGIFRLAKKYAYFEKESDRKRREDREKVRNIQRAQRKLDDKGRGRSRRKTKVKAGQTGRDGDDASAADGVPSVVSADD
jgi:small subunit ribosomal protein S21